MIMIRTKIGRASVDYLTVIAQESMIDMDQHIYRWPNDSKETVLENHVRNFSDGINELFTDEEIEAAVRRALRNRKTKR